MAEEISFQGAEVKKRHPWGVWALGIITLGVYHLVWWYKINRELRDYSAAAGRPLGNNPTTSVLAILPGAFIIVPPYWTIATTSSRVRQVKSMVEGVPSSEPNPALSVLLGFILGLQTVYIGYAINAAWTAAQAKAGEGGLPALAAGAAPAAAPEVEAPETASESDSG